MASIIKRSLRKIVKILKLPFSETVLVIGDSHTEAFNAFTAKQFIFELGMYQFEVCSVGGATVSGLRNTNSHTQAYQKFKKAISDFNGDKIFVMLGEVDTGFVIWLKSDNKNIPVEISFEHAVSNYCWLLDQIKDQFQVHVFSTPLPTINDSVAVGEVAIKRASISASQKQRTELTLNFNKKIESYCLANEIIFMSLDDDSLGTDMLVKKALLSTDVNDHHYNHDTFCSMLANKIKNTMNSS
jgi:hypothetical protein